MPPKHRSHSTLKRPSDQMEVNSVNATPKQKKKISTSNEENAAVGEIENRDDFQELIVTYMNPAFATVVCKWCSMAEEKPDKMMQCEVEKISIACQNKYLRRCDIKICGKNNYNRRLENVKPTDVFSIIRFLHTTDITVSGFRTGELNALNTRMSTNWRKNISKLSLKTAATEDSCLEFVHGFSNLTELDVTRASGYYGTLLAQPYIRNMASIDRIRLMSDKYSTEETDSILALICNKSRKINKVEISCSFSIEAIINFIKNCRFSDYVHLKLPPSEPEDEQELLNFVQSCNGVCTEHSAYVTRLEFEYGGTSFEIVYGASYLL